MKSLYVIDSTARQYGFKINGSLKVKVFDEVINITGSKEDIDTFHQIMLNSDPFTIIVNEEEFVAFSGKNIIGIKVTKE